MAYNAFLKVLEIFNIIFLVWKILNYDKSRATEKFVEKIFILKNLNNDLNVKSGLKSHSKPNIAFIYHNNSLGNRSSF